VANCRINSLRVPSRLWEDLRLCRPWHVEGDEMRFVVAWVWLAALVGVAHGGDNKAAARDSYREGTRQYDLGDYQKALELFKRAYLLFEEPSILFNSAQCERQLKHPEEAVKLYKSYLRKVPTPPIAPTSRK
jgi:tetratricopeptide (TPR) repeat protein